MIKMPDTDNFEILCMGLIANSGEAKSEYIAAIRLAREGNFEGAKKSWNVASEAYQNAHKVHFEMFQLEVEAENHMQRLFLIHAEDQLSSAETFKILSEEIIELYHQIKS